MKKLLAIVPLVASFVFVAPAFASGSQSSAPFVTPTNGFLYNLKITLEDIKQGVLHIISPKGEARYIIERIDERNAEMQKMRDEYLTKVEARDKAGANYAVTLDQDAFLRAQALVADEQRALDRSEAQPKVYEKATLSAYLNKQTLSVDPQQDILRDMATRLAALRAGLIAANAAGDEKQVAAISAELKSAQSDYVQALDVHANVMQAQDSGNSLLWDRLLKALDLTPAERADDIQARADAVKKRINDEEDALRVEPALRTDFSAYDQQVAKAVADAKAHPDARRLTFAEFAKMLMGADADSQRRIKEDAAKKQLPQEKAQTPPAQKNQPQKQIAPEKAPAEPQPKKTLQTIPSATVSTKPLQLLGFYDGLNGKVGQPFDVSFGGQDGLPPYHFQKDTGAGFPPMGLILDTNGRLSGTPSIAGTTTFGVCVVDTAGKSACGSFTMVVAPADVAPQPVQPQLDCSNITKLPAECTDGCYPEWSNCLNTLPSNVSDSVYYHDRDICDAAFCNCKFDCIAKRPDASCYTRPDCNAVLNNTYQ